MIIEIKNIKKKYKKGFNVINALDDVSFSVEEGKIVGILGGNGAGKTTLLKIITGITNPYSGSVEIIGETDVNLVKKQIGFLPENPTFFKNITAFELLQLSLTLVGIYSDDKIEQALNRVELIKNKNEKVKTFSKGMMQRLGIAQAIIHLPKILILDEPMSGLDPIGRKMVKDMILEYRKSGKTVLFSTHNLDDIETLCDEVIMIKEGRVVLNKNISSLRSSNSYRFEIVKNNVRDMFLIKGKEKFWEFLKNIKDENQEIISIKSDLSSELEQYYEK
jgi:ABC-2 type transport system ATP-binding protein